MQLCHRSGTYPCIQWWHANQARESFSHREPSFPPLTSWSLFWIDRDGNEEEIKISRPYIPPRQQQHHSWLQWRRWVCRNFLSRCLLLWGLAGDWTAKFSQLSPPWGWSATVHSRSFQVHCHPSSGGWDLQDGNTSSSSWQLLRFPAGIQEMPLGLKQLVGLSESPTEVTPC